MSADFFSKSSKKNDLLNLKLSLNWSGFDLLVLVVESTYLFESSHSLYLHLCLTFLFCWKGQVICLSQLICLSQVIYYIFTFVCPSVHSKKQTKEIAQQKIKKNDGTTIHQCAFPY